MTPSRTGETEGRIEARVAEGLRLLEARRFEDATLLFERVLQFAPEDEAARQGLSRARAGASEAERHGRAQLHRANEALAQGDRAGARLILENLLAAGTAPDASAALLEKLDERGGLLTLFPPASRPPHDATRLSPSPGRPLSRRAFAVFWCAMVLTLGAGVAFSWDRLVDRLVEAPSPDARLVPPTTRLPEPTAGERALTEARRRLEAGDRRAAIASLDAIEPGQAVYPFARQLRERLAREDGASR